MHKAEKSMKKRKPRLEAWVAVSLRPGEADDLDVLEHRRFLWNAWKRRHWPAEVVRKGLRLYGFDPRTRTFRALLQITRGGSFIYRFKRELSDEIHRVTGWRPSFQDRYGRAAPTPSGDAYNTGVALRWRVLKRVDIPFKGRFPQLGWLRLNPERGVVGDLDPFEAFAEGGRQIRSHMRIERNRVLRSRARTFWRSKLGRLHCLVCGFDFEKRYGDLKADFIEMHHDRPVSTLGRAGYVRLGQLKPLCANCHRMIHREAPMVELSQLKARLRREWRA